MWNGKFEEKKPSAIQKHICGPGYTEKEIYDYLQQGGKQYLEVLPWIVLPYYNQVSSTLLNMKQ